MSFNPLETKFKGATNITVCYFCVRHKNRRKHNQHFKTAIFQNKFTLWQIRLYMWETKFTSHKQHLFGLLFLRNAKKTDADQSILQALLIQSQKKRLTNL